MKFSLAIPCYNEEKNLPLLLESINKLNYPRNDLEIIIIDNNCIDRTVEIAKNFGVDKIVKEEKQGLTYARQRGFLSAEGEIVCCIDADCQLPVNWLKNASLFFEDSKIIAISGPYDYFDANPIFRNISLFFQSVFYPLVPKFLNLFFKKPAALIIGGNSLIRKSALEKIGGFDTSVKFWGEDTLTAFRLAKIGKVVFSSRMKIFSSSRRFQKDGYFKTSIYYFFNYFCLYFKNKPFVKEK